MADATLSTALDARDSARLLLICNAPERAVHLTALLHDSGRLPGARGPTWSLTVASAIEQALDQLIAADAVLLDLPDPMATIDAIGARAALPVIAVVRAGVDPVALAQRVDEIIPEEELTPLVLERTLRVCDTRHALTGQIEFLAQRDVLTGLPNRKLFERQVELALHSAERHDRILAVGCIGIDNFLAAAADLGQAGTESMLVTIAERLAGTLRRSDLVARAHEDSFLLMLELGPEATDLAATADKLLAAVRAPIAGADGPVQITASLGLALFPSGGRTVADLLKEARMALAEVQASGGGDFRFFDTELEVVTRQRLQIEQALPGALERDELSVLYQPRLDLSQMRITGAEVLARWQSPEFGEVSPERFIPIAEESGAIGRVGTWVLRAALADLCVWRTAGHDVRIGVNISAGQFRGEDFAPRVRTELDTAGIDPQALELEITERVFVANVTEHLSLFDDLTELGIGFAVDDFGIGYSSLAYLKHFPVHSLKIDRVFVTPLPDSREDAAIVRAIVALGHALDLRVVAEGVETQAQLEFLRGAGCDEAQGFLISPGCTASAFAAMLEDGIMRIGARQPHRKLEFTNKQSDPEN